MRDFPSCVARSVFREKLHSAIPRCIPLPSVLVGGGIHGAGMRRLATHPPAAATTKAPRAPAGLGSWPLPPPFSWDTSGFEYRRCAVSAAWQRRAVSAKPPPLPISGTTAARIRLSTRYTRYKTAAQFPRPAILPDRPTPETPSQCNASMIDHSIFRRNPRPPPLLPVLSTNDGAQVLDHTSMPHRVIEAAERCRRGQNLQQRRE